jgi:hypothetical protein
MQDSRYGDDGPADGVVYDGRVEQRHSDCAADELHLSHHRCHFVGRVDGSWLFLLPPATKVNGTLLNHLISPAD